MAPSSAALVPILAATLCTWVPAQRSDGAPEGAAWLVRVIVNWANAFDSGELDIAAAPDRSTERLYEDYPVDGLGVPGKGRKTTHMAVLHGLLYEAENRASNDIARAVLYIAAAGFDRSLFDPEVLSVRDLGHFTLMRMEAESNEVRAFLMDAATARPISWYPGLDPEPVSTAQQSAAIRLLGASVNQRSPEEADVLRVPLESRLRDNDPRVRLAAAEALTQMRRSESIPVVTRAVVAERHPVVSQALVHTLESLLARAGEDGDVTIETATAGTETAMRAMGRSGWRTDMALVELAAEHPSKGVIVPLLDALEGVEEDSLVRAVNEKASPRLRLRVWEVLSELTGYRAPMEEPAAWREFWEREKDNIEIYKRKKPETMTRATFFGIPVTGQQIAFAIDTSGSMKDLVSKPEELVTRRTTSRRRRNAPSDTQWSRLDAAKAQLLTAVQSMDSDSRYHLITFSDRVLTWSRRPVPPGPSSRRSLTGVLGKLKTGGGTNIYGALYEGLGADQARFGQQSEYGVDELFLLSDGEPTAGQVEDTETILRLVAELNRYQNIRINTVFTGTGRGANFLRRLAEENGGVFVQR